MVGTVRPKSRRRSAVTLLAPVCHATIRTSRKGHVTAVIALLLDILTAVIIAICLARYGAFYILVRPMGVILFRVSHQAGRRGAGPPSSLAGPAS